MTNPRNLIDDARPIEIGLCPQGGFDERKKALIVAASLALLPCIAGAQALVTDRSISLNAAIEMATAASSAVEPTATR